MTKKSKILKLFYAAHWNDSPSGRFKTITGSDFHDAGLCFSLEFGAKWSDIHYARRIVQELGYKVGIGYCFYVNEINH